MQTQHNFSIHHSQLAEIFLNMSQKMLEHVCDEGDIQIPHVHGPKVWFRRAWAVRSVQALHHLNFYSPRYCTLYRGIRR